MQNRRRQFGFTVVEGLLLFVIAGIIGFVGWYVWNAKRNTDKIYSGINNCDAFRNCANGTLQEQQGREDIVVIGNVTFKNASKFSEALRNEIITKITDPLNYFHSEIVKVTAVKSITVSSSDDEVYAYKVEYEGTDGINNGGYLFGIRGEPMEYWYPLVCDDTINCPSYLQEFKKKFPKNYEEYQKAQNTSTQ